MGAIVVVEDAVVDDDRFDDDRFDDPVRGFVAIGIVVVVVLVVVVDVVVVFGIVVEGVMVVNMTGVVGEVLQNSRPSTLKGIRAGKQGQISPLNTTRTLFLRPKTALVLDISC